MTFHGFDLDVSPSRATAAAQDEMRQVGEILERENLISRVPAHRFLRVLLGKPVAAGASLAAAHDLWQPGYFGKVGTLEGFPRQPEDIVCPAGLVGVSVDCVVQTIGGMGPYWDFAGYYLSLLVSLDEGRIWDARGETTP
jgi:hypothetical protein